MKWFSKNAHDGHMKSGDVTKPQPSRALLNSNSVSPLPSDTSKAINAGDNESNATLEDEADIHSPLYQVKVKHFRRDEVSGKHKWESHGSCQLRFDQDNERMVVNSVSTNKTQLAIISSDNMVSVQRGTSHVRCNIYNARTKERETLRLKVKSDNDVDGLHDTLKAICDPVKKDWVWGW